MNCTPVYSCSTISYHVSLCPLLVSFHSHNSTSSLHTLSDMNSHPRPHCTTLNHFSRIQVYLLFYSHQLFPVQYSTITFQTFPVLCSGFRPLWLCCTSSHPSRPKGFPSHVVCETKFLLCIQKILCLIVYFYT